MKLTHVLRVCCGTVGPCQRRLRYFFSTTLFSFSFAAFALRSDTSTSVPRIRIGRENHTRIACQALVLSERTEGVIFVFNCVAEIADKGDGAPPNVRREWRVERSE